VQNIRATTESPKAAIAIFEKGTKIIFHAKFVPSQLHVGYVLVSSTAVTETARRYPPIPITVCWLVNGSGAKRRRRFPNLFFIKSKGKSNN